MKQWLPDNAARKALTQPEKVPSFLYNRGREVLSSVHTALAAGNIPIQQDKLALLRKSDDFCLIVLDACRYDALKQEFGTYFSGSVQATKTPARSTFEYLQYTWPETYAFPYVTAAPPATSERFDFNETDKGTGLPQESEELYNLYRGYVPANHFKNLVEVWRQWWDTELRTCPPEPVTEQAIEVAKETEKMVVHYFQPHAPFIGEQQPRFDDTTGTNISDADFTIDSEVWPAVKSGELSKEALQEYYVSNLQRALAAVAHLIRQTTFDKYVIIGDHGEALGEYGGYQHGIEHPHVTTVPWASVDRVLNSAPEMWDYSPVKSPNQPDQTEQHLRDLGYI